MNNLDILEQSKCSKCKLCKECLNEFIKINESLRKKYHTLFEEQYRFIECTICSYGAKLTQDNKDLAFGQTIMNLQPEFDKIYESNYDLIKKKCFVSVHTNQTDYICNCFINDKYVFKEIGLSLINSKI